MIRCTCTNAKPNQLDRLTTCPECELKLARAELLRVVHEATHSLIALSERLSAPAQEVDIKPFRVWVQRPKPEVEFTSVKVLCRDAREAADKGLAFAVEHSEQLKWEAAPCDVDYDNFMHRNIEELT